MPQHCWIDLQYCDSRLTASRWHSCWAQVNWHLISSFSGSVSQPNSAYQAQSLMWGEWCKVNCVNWAVWSLRLNTKAQGSAWINSGSVADGRGQDGSLQRDDTYSETWADHSCTLTFFITVTGVFLPFTFTMNYFVFVTQKISEKQKLKHLQRAAELFIIIILQSKQPFYFQMTNSFSSFVFKSTTFRPGWLIVYILCQQLLCDFLKSNPSLISYPR